MNRMIVSGCSRNSIGAVAIAVALVLTSGTIGTAGPITFSTFVSNADIAAAENGQTNTIGFTYAGNKFVGSLYFGSNNFQLFSTDLTGGNVQKFGAPVPQSANFNGEVVLGASLGKGGFPTGDIYAAAGDEIYHYANSGGAPSFFAATTDGSTVRQVFFDPGNSFGGNMLVTTSAGDIYNVASNGMMSLVANTGEDTEGIDIATSAWGSYAGDLLTASEGSGTLRLISPSGSITPIGYVPSAETVSFVPNFNGGNPLEGFYVANYPVDIQFASASQFASLQGDAIVTSEFGSNAPLWDVHYNGGTSFSINGPIGNLPNQSEDGIFVTAQRIADVNSAVPEPASALLLGQGMVAVLGFAWRERRKRRTTVA